MNKVEIIESWYQIAEKTDTFLSPFVRELVLDKGIALREINIAAADTALEILNRLRRDETFNTSRLAASVQLLGSTRKEHHQQLMPQPAERTGEWFSQQIKDFAPWFALIHNIMNTLAREDGAKDEFTSLCSWMHQPEVIQLCHQLLYSPEHATSDDINSHECLLIVTAALERALGNLYLFGGGTKVPSLLRDLLASTELLALLGPSHVVPLQLLMGSPLSLNLRNIVWHGFVGADEIDLHRYASVLLFLSASIGCHLEDITIPYRRSWTDLSRLQQLPKWFDWTEEELTEAVVNCRGLPTNRKKSWLRAIQHYREKRYGRACVTLLPEMELLLRLIYCAANDCPLRALTAESVVHYTTLDVILSPSNNLINNFLGRSLHSALLDLFVESEGPHLRDRFSHGECRITAVSAQVPQHLLALSIALLLLPSQSLQLPVHYSPVFTQTALFRKELVETLRTVGDWMQFVGVDDGISVVLTQFGASSWQNIAQIVSDSILLPKLLDQQSTLIGVWRISMKQTVVGCNLIQDKLKSYRNAQLRSRQRATHARLESYLPLYARAILRYIQLPLAHAIRVSPAVSLLTHRRINIGPVVTCWADNLVSASVKCRWMELGSCANDFLRSTEP